MMGRGRKFLLYKDVKQYFENERCKLISIIYKNNKEPLEYIALCGHKNIMNLKHFKSGRGRKCKNCSHKNNLTREENVKKFTSNKTEKIGQDI